MFFSLTFFIFREKKLMKIYAYRQSWTKFSVFGLGWIERKRKWMNFSSLFDFLISITIQIKNFI